MAGHWEKPERRRDVERAVICGRKHEGDTTCALAPEEELQTLELMNERFAGKAPLRIDPNGRWTVNTAIRIGRSLDDLPLEYYEDPVNGMRAMADVRSATGLKLSTNSCVSRWRRLADAAVIRPIDVLLADICWFGGISGVQALGTAAEAWAGGWAVTATITRA